MFQAGRSRSAAFAVAVLALCGCARHDVELADGSGASWEQWQGKWLVINYWAEWCAPCRKEIPELNRFSRNGEDAGVVVLGVNFDGLQGDDLTNLIGRMHIEFPVLTDDPGPRWDQTPPSVLPSTLIIGPKGDLQTVLVGPQTYESLARAVHLTAQM